MVEDQPKRCLSWKAIQGFGLFLIISHPGTFISPACSQCEPQYYLSCCCSVAQLCPILQYPIDCSTLGLLVPHHHLEFPQVLVYCIRDAIQPSHPLMPPSPSALKLSQHQGLFFQWVSFLLQMTKYWSFSFSIRYLRWTLMFFQKTCP